MKKIFAVVGAAICLILLPFFVNASVLKLDPKYEAGILPDSFWFFADEFGEELRFVFIWGKENKLKYLDGTMNERAAEKAVLNLDGQNDYDDALNEKIERMKERQVRFEGTAIEDENEGYLAKIKKYFR